MLSSRLVFFLMAPSAIREKLFQQQETTTAAAATNREEEECFLCRRPSLLRCPWCHERPHYCSPEHFRLYHRVRSRCWPVAVAANTVVATRDVIKGELLFEEKAAVVAPSPHSAPVCPGCFGGLRKIEKKCPNCRIPICGETDCCESDEWHRDAECEVLSKVKVDPKASEPHFVYSVMILLRMLALKKKEELWSRINLLKSHAEKRRGLGEWNMFQVDVVDFVRRKCKIGGVGDAEMHRLIGIFVCNSISVETTLFRSEGQQQQRRQRLARCLFPLLALAKHDCLSNAEVRLLEDKSLNFRPRAVVRARRDIRAGEEITVQRMSTILGTHKRRRRLQSELHLDCNCSRCSDPTELGTFVSALSCEACEVGSMLPEKPLEPYSGWNCSLCEFKLDVSEVEGKVDQIEEELAEVKGDLERLEGFIQHYSGKILHENHFLLLLARRNLALVRRRKEVQRLLQSPAEAATPGDKKDKSKSLLGDHAWILRRLQCEGCF